MRCALYGWSENLQDGRSRSVLEASVYLFVYTRSLLLSYF
uniref:Uncharacterized protein n=1 Tax=Anguilla anguilla TaxID=7936 RepID=A0A0E9R0Y0_ANGAN